MSLTIGTIGVLANTWIFFKYVLLIALGRLSLYNISSIYKSLNMSLINL